MSHPVSADDANKFAKEAMARMGGLGIAPTPDNFTVWYCYVTKRDPDICHRIDWMLENGRVFDADECSALYLRCLAITSNEMDDKRDTALINASADVEQSVAEVMAMLEEASADTERYTETLTSAGGELASAKAAGAVRKIVSNLVEETKRVADQNRKFNDRLEQSNKEIAELNERITDARKEAMCDGLTGLHNRRAFDVELQRAVEDTHTSGSELSLLMLDIDHFKKFNDTHGHLLGDQVIKLVARCLTDCTKGHDTPARYGGEEFSIILPNTTAEGAIAVAQQICETVATKHIRRKATGENLGGVTISVGAAQFGGKESPEELLERADTALYAAKNAGRNRVELAPGGPALRVVANSGAA
jgi:diguanylate cyclase